MNTENQRNLEQYIDHEVVDQNGDKIGKLTSLWSDSQGEPAYLGVQTGWLFGKTHVVPADRAQVNGNSQTIRLPYTVQQVKDAPSYDPGVELDAGTETQLRSYYGSGGRSEDSVAAQTRQKPATAPRRSKGTREGAGTRQESANVKLHEEQVKIGKRQVDAGRVRLRKIIRTETVNQPVELQREEIVVERVSGPQSGEPASAEFEQEDIFIPLRREEAVVQKEARVREEVRVSKKAQTERQTVSEQVRKEDVEVQRTGAGPASVRGRADQTGQRSTPSGQRGTRAVFGICGNEQRASEIVTQLKDAGYSNNDN